MSDEAGQTTRRSARRGAPAAAEHALLGLLARAGSDQAAHGYDLARQFAEGQPLGEVIRLEPGMLYHHLKTLDKRGWVAAETEPQPSRPPRRTVRLTDAGRAELARWLSEPVAHTREIRLEFLLKLYFANLLDPGRGVVLVREQRAVLATLADALAGQLAAVPADDEREPRGTPVAFRAAVLRLRLAQTRAALTWLDGLGDGEL